MIKFVNKFTQLSTNLLSPDERYYFTTAYKNAVGNRRAELRLLTSIELKEQRNQNKTMTDKLKKYKKKIETELVDLCKGLLKIIDEQMLPSSKNPENEIYYMKMKADYMR
jgi:14-3-3 protein epsilon